MKNILIILGVLIPNIAYSGTIRHDVPKEKYSAYAAKYKYVGRINGPVRNGVGRNGQMVDGTATLINERWLVTAAHVMYYADISSKFYLDGKSYTIDKIILNDFKDEIQDMTKNLGDIALCRLSTPIVLDEYAQLYDERNETSKMCDIVGFGVFGVASFSERVKDNIKRAGTNIVNGIIGDKLICDMSSSNPTELEFCISAGDSGGPLFIDGKLAGIHSFVDGSGKFKYGDDTYHTRISDYADWIKVMTDENLVPDELQIVEKEEQEQINIEEKSRTWSEWFSSLFGGSKPKPKLFATQKKSQTSKPPSVTTSTQPFKRANFRTQSKTPQIPQTPDCPNGKCFQPPSNCPDGKCGQSSGFLIIQ